MHAARKDQGIVVEITKEFKNIDVCLTRLKKLVKAVCNRFKLSKATISIAIVDDAQIRKVNKQFLNLDSTTDCLSFDLSDDNTEALKSFELVVNAEMAIKEAKLRAHSSEAELALYITHSLLHNFGFDDSRQDSLQKMHETEDEILQQQGYGLVYSL